MNQWSDIIIRGNLIFPDEFVVRFLSNEYKNISDNKNKTAVDFGCGAGRHLNLLQMWGFNTIGVDINSDIFEVATNNFNNLNEANVTLINTSMIDYIKSDNSFDLAILWGTIFIQDRSSIIRTLRDLRKNTNPKGKICLNFRTKNNWFYQLGHELSDSYYVLDERAGEYSEFKYYFTDEMDLRSIIQESGFSIQTMELNSITKNNGTEHHEWFQLILR